MKRWFAASLAGLLLLGLTVPAVATDGGKQAPPDPAVPMIADLDGNGIFDTLESMIAGARPGDKFDVIVQLRVPASEQAMVALQKAAGPHTVTARWDKALNGYAAQMTAAQITALSRHQHVIAIEEDREVFAMMGTATQWTGVNQARTDFGVEGDRDGSVNSYSKNDIVVAIIDTGIDAAHSDLNGGKVIGWRDEVNGQTSAYDDQGHGTHVAGIVAGTGAANPAYKGVAPGAALVGIKVLNSQGSGTTTAIINGINWMINNKATYNIRIANMSLGGSGCSNGTDSLSAAVNNASNNGIVMMVAAGNSGPAKCTVGSPAAAAEAITVGAGVDPGENGWGLAQFSSRGLTSDGRLKPDIVTPGVNIMAAKANSGNQYVSYSGTSMATPFAAGIAALMLDANPSLTVSGVKSILYSGANLEDWGPAGHDLDYGRGMVLGYNAIRQAAGGTGTYSHGLSRNHVSSSFSAKGQNYYYDIVVTDASRPIAVTMIMPNHSCGWFSCSPDFDLYLIAPNGTTVAKSEGTKRQEQINFMPSATGTYKVRVYAYNGTGSFFFDVSYR